MSRRRQHTGRAQRARYVEPERRGLAAIPRLREHLNFAIRMEVSCHREGDRLVADAVEHGSDPSASPSTSDQ